MRAFQGSNSVVKVQDNILSLQRKKAQYPVYVAPSGVKLCKMVLPHENSEALNNN